MKNISLLILIILIIITISCAQTKLTNSHDVSSSAPRYLFPSDYMADPAARVFNGKLYIYPSHDRNSAGYGSSLLDGGAYDMVDYYVFSLDDVFSGEVTNHGVVLALSDIPWARGQLWDNDVAYKNGKYYMYFPAKDHNNLFRIGVAIADRPEGPFIPQPEPIIGSYSIDPCVFEDEGNFYMYFGGIWGGQLQFYEGNTFVSRSGRSNSGISPRVVKLRDDMLQFAESPREISLIDKNGRVLASNNSRFFEAAWMHKYNDKYYFSYSTGDTHNICYATGDNPYGPFTYQGLILTPVIGWTSHHSIVEFKEQWYLFYHDSRPSGGTDHLRSMKVTKLTHLPDGTIERINGQQ